MAPIRTTELRYDKTLVYLIRYTEESRINETIVRKQIIIFIVVSLMILLIGYALFELFIVEEFDAGPDHHPDSNGVTHAAGSHSGAQNENTADAAAKMRILSTVGTVEKRSGQGSHWVPVVSGDELLAKDSIKTDKNATARLAANDNSELELREQSEIDLNKITSQIHAIDLKQGQLQVKYRKDKSRTIRVSSADSGSVAESDSGNFIVQNHQGTVSLATSEGKVRLTSNDKTVVVASGQYSTAEKGRSPGPAAPIPIEVMLRVATTNLKAKDAPETIIQGQADPGARVFASGVSAEMEPDGSFEVVVPRSPKQKQIRLVASTPWGSRTKKLRVSSGGGPTRIEKAKVRWGRKSDSSKKK